MELNNLEGHIVGVVANIKSDQIHGFVKNIVIKKSVDALKMVGLEKEILEQDFDLLSIVEQNKVLLASKLQDKVIVLNNFSQGLSQKEREDFKKLFKKIIKYGRKVILVDKNSEMFLNCVDHIYVVDGKEVVYATEDIFDENLSAYMDLPKIVEFVAESQKIGIKINHYKEFDELLKAIYRIKS